MACESMIFGVPRLKAAKQNLTTKSPGHKDSPRKQKINLVFLGATLESW
jgi:hypothetical protein